MSCRSCVFSHSRSMHTVRVVVGDGHRNTIIIHIYYCIIEYIFIWNIIFHQMLLAQQIPRMRDIGKIFSISLLLSMLCLSSGQHTYISIIRTEEGTQWNPIDACRCYDYYDIVVFLWRTSICLISFFSVGFTALLAWLRIHILYRFWHQSILLQL